MIPFWDEYRLSRRIEEKREPCIVHFLWGEFASPRWPGFFRNERSKLVGGFHCSPRRWKSVLGAFRLFSNYDHITLTSQVQVDLVLEHGVSRDNISVIPLGVDTDYFRPALRKSAVTRPFRAIMVGETERDHEFLNQVALRMPPDRFELAVRTSEESTAFYKNNPSVKIMARFSDDDFLQFYQNADLMIMPMLDSAANDALLESMACGTPVMVNRVGGIPEYVDASCNYVMEDKNVDEWADVLMSLLNDRSQVESRRMAVCQSMERFAWKRVAMLYRALYARLLNG
ncbi:MAG: hypothetical protein A2X46_05070 [Lentisphaerae bacterium GWF2_57_35]|nr:MAG: hypothetical protein A2X46_05070 [Lentisphaerae bacterium GWF2_57_35]